MDDEAVCENEALKQKPHDKQHHLQKFDNIAMNSSSAMLFDSNSTQKQFILLQKPATSLTDNQADSTSATRIPVQITQTLQQQTPGTPALSIMRPQVVHKVRPADPRVITTLNHRNIIPVQLSKGQAIIINPVGQSVTAKYPILPKGASPEKQIAHQSGTNQMLLPISRVSGINSSTTLTVRSIAPRLAAGPLQGNEAEKKPRLQSQALPRAIAPQPPQIMLQPPVCQAASVVQLQRPNNLKPSSIQALGNIRIQGPSGQMMQAVIAPVQMRSSLSQDSIIVNTQSKLSRFDTGSLNGDDLVVDTKPLKKPCNCTKSQCLKLYCECFANGEFCNNCNCHNCSNNIDHEAERSKAIKSCLERNPNAFHPKIGKTRGVAERRHTKGCHCKRSGCLKNYCECYEAKIMCSALCKCTGCKNFEESPERKTLMHLADAAEVRVLQQNAARSKLESQLEVASLKSGLATAEKRLPFTFITTPVVNATCECMMARAEEAELNNLSQQKAEKLIIEEFGRSLLQIIQATDRSKDYNA